MEIWSLIPNTCTHTPAHAHTHTHTHSEASSSCIVKALHSPLKHVFLVDGVVLINDGAKSSKNFVENGLESLDSLGTYLGSVVHYNHAFKTRLNHWLVLQQVS